MANMDFLTVGQQREFDLNSEKMKFTTREIKRVSREINEMKNRIKLNEACLEPQHRWNRVDLEGVSAQEVFDMMNEGYTFGVYYDSAVLQKYIIETDEIYEERIEKEKIQIQKLNDQLNVLGSELQTLQTNQSTIRKERSDMFKAIFKTV